MREHRRRAPAALIATLLTLSLGGCAIGPAYHPPAPPASAAFKEPPPEGWRQAQPNEAFPRGAWWTVFSDPQLNALEDQVSISNQNVIAAIAQYREARDQVRIARASLFPTITATPAVTNSKTSETFARGRVTNFVSGSIVDYNLPVDVSYQADVWGSIRRSVAAAAATAQASAADLENAKLTYQAQLAEMYFELHGLDADADLLQKTLVLYEQSLQLTQDRFSAGVVSGADVAQAQTQLATTRGQAIDLGVARAQYEHAIAILVGKAPSELSIPVAVLNTPAPPIPAGLPSALMERRPDITAMERAVAAANQQIGIAKSAFFPVLTLSGSGGFESSSLAQWFTWPSRFWSVGPQLAATLFEGGKRRAQVDLSEAAYDHAAASYRQTVLTAFQQVEDELSGLRILEQEG
ncbi:MAG TPA: efflux transporter outer membrane subunit, partial [Vicinamibacterales bacterium]|nr:efflux transporter outer membrane subunit [Vicinamibacterales bacterium]